ncbi:UbiA prenyltransferase family [Aspergillus karnatakaensis]|uniref:4-hydroxybenzoate octaprenyltransferase n=1 Tax=Aspergillus karnatakaensis TaxID=1810916 RepID=UPI003CCDB7C0
MYSKSWILNAAPTPVVPYIELTRVGYLPVGVLVSYFPVLIAILHVATLSHLPQPLLLSAVLKWLPLCYLYSAYGCVVDDIADQDLDRKVERCQHRPLVRGAVSTPSAILWAASLAATVIYLGTTFFPNQPALHIPIAIFGSIVYPFLKRFTHYALTWLALLYVATALNASRTIGYDILSPETPRNFLTSNLALNAAVYIANIIVETIYMHADVEDDIKSGIGSLAVRIYGFSKPVLFTLWAVYAGLVYYAGVEGEMGQFYFTGAVCSVVTLGALIARVDLKDAKMCEVLFFVGNAVVMAEVAGGLGAEYLLGA